MWSWWATGPDEPPADLATRRHGTWVRFATTGNAGWDTYDDERRAAMRIDTEWTRSDGPRSQERQAWR